MLYDTRILLGNQTTLPSAAAHNVIRQDLWHKPTFILLFTQIYPFSFPLFFANGLTVGLPVSFGVIWRPLLGVGRKRA